jgi:hypothetical protein
MKTARKIATCAKAGVLALLMTTPAIGRDRTRLFESDARNLAAQWKTSLDKKDQAGISKWVARQVWLPEQTELGCIASSRIAPNITAEEFAACAVATPKKSKKLKAALGVVLSACFSKTALYDQKTGAFTTKTGYHCLLDIDEAGYPVLFGIELKKEKRQPSNHSVERPAAR